MRKNEYTRQFADCEKGGALLEFAIILPLMLTFILGGLEFASILKRCERLSTISREAANRSFRECVKHTSPADCLHDVGNQTMQYASEMVPGLAISLSIYSFNTTTFTAQKTAFFASNTTNDSYATRYNESNFIQPSNIINAENKSIAISEAYYNPTTLGHYLFSVLNIAPRTIYETAVF